MLGFIEGQAVFWYSVERSWCFYILVGLSFLWSKRLNWKELNLHLPILQNGNIVKWQRQKRQPAIKSLLEIPNRTRFQITQSKFQFSQSGSLILLRRNNVPCVKIYSWQSLIKVTTKPQQSNYSPHAKSPKWTPAHQVKWKFPFEAHTISTLAHILIFIV